MRKSLKNNKKEEYLRVWYDQRQYYPLSYKLACAVETIQYTSASIERLFSDMGNIVTVKRNRLTVENIEACLLIRQEKREKENYFTPEMFKVHLRSQDSQIIIESKESIARRSTFDNESYPMKRLKE